MASSGKKKTTMAKLNREAKVREKRMDKQARKDARKYAAANGTTVGDDTLASPDGEPAEADDGQPDRDAVVPALSDA